MARRKKILWKNAEVDLPILSTHEIARHKKSLTYFEDGGYIEDLITNKRINFIQAGGVYLLQLKIPKRLAHDEKCPPSCTVDHGKDFGRQG